LQALSEADKTARAELHQQLDQARTELAAIKQQLDKLTARAGGPR
jgi:hypothetical protein